MIEDIELDIDSLNERLQNSSGKIFLSQKWCSSKFERF